MNPYLLITLLFCHFLADFTPLSSKWMLDAKRFGKPLYPIFLHACMHASLMGIAMILFGVGDMQYLVAFFLQMITHFIIDVTKGRVNKMFPAVQSPANSWHWIVFGFDQFLHAVVIVVMCHIV